MEKIVFGLAVGLAAVLAAACSSEDPAVTNDANVVNVSVISNQFDPPSVKIKVGQTVRWTWSGGQHNVVSGSACPPAPGDGKFKSGAAVAGGTFDKKFEATGTFPYYCEPHCSLGMKGEIIVE